MTETKKTIKLDPALIRDLKVLKANLDFKTYDEVINYALDRLKEKK